MHSSLKCTITSCMGAVIPFMFMGFLCFPRTSNASRRTLPTCNHAIEPPTTDGRGGSLSPVLIAVIWIQLSPVLWCSAAGGSTHTKKEFSKNMYGNHIHPHHLPNPPPQPFWLFELIFFPRQHSSLFIRDRVSVATSDSLAATLTDTGGAYGDWGYLGMY